VIAGALIGANCCGSTGAAIGSAAGPVGTLFGAAFGFYVGAIAGSTPSLLYGVYCESEKLKQKEVDRMWKIIYFGMKKYENWIGKEKKQFDVCDAIIVECTQSIVQCLDENDNEEQESEESAENENDFEYNELDDELLDIWKYEMNLIPILQECLVK